MAVLIEHEKRKEEILEKAFDLFVEEGYEDVTFQKIADRCGITRTTLYIYFKNKREIFRWSIKQFLSSIEARIVSIAGDEGISAAESLEKTLGIILDECEKNSRLFKVLLPYLLQMQKSGGDVKKVVERRIVKLQHFINVILIRGRGRGEFNGALTIKDMYAMILSVVESAVFRLAVIGETELASSRATMGFVLGRIREVK
ncbi:MAG: TetR/AcrR family transcriptional regulator [Treponema sp.]|nr:TetR/AcrR family transcriptional regulator [Treponema sp.]